MGSDDICNTGTGLGLSLGLGSLVTQENYSQSNQHRRKKRKLPSRDDPFFPSLTLGPSDDADRKAHDDEPTNLRRQASSVTAVSSFSNSSVQKERDFGDEDDEASHRKKLRLSKQQYAILEDSFKEHTNLNPKLKKALADQLNLRPRQVEVWFQNRRARTKLKQTEADCELLKTCCETLTEQNKRLQKELQELRSRKSTASYSMQLPAAATLTMCSSCERITDDGENTVTTTSIPFTIGQSHFLNPLSHPSATCS